MVVTDGGMANVMKSGMITNFCPRRNVSSFRYSATDTQKRKDATRRQAELLLSASANAHTIIAAVPNHIDTEIWTPDVELYNAVEQIHKTTGIEVVQVDNNGIAFWSRPGQCL